MFGRDRRHERREARTGGPEVTRYQMRQRMISIGDDYVIENNHGERVYKLDGKALRIENDLVRAHGPDRLSSGGRHRGSRHHRHIGPPGLRLQAEHQVTATATAVLTAARRHGGQRTIKTTAKLT